MKKSINEELDSIKFLFKYRAGKVISEQEQFESKDVDFDEGMMSDQDLEHWKNRTNQGDKGMEFDEDLIENRELEVPVKPGTKTPTKPKKPGTPYSPKPGPKKAPKAKIPEWLSFDAIGVNIN